MKVTNRQLQGVPASPGLARGPVYRWMPSLEIPRFKPQDPAAELERLRRARQQAAQELRRLAQEVAQRLSAQEGAILEAQAMFMDDPSLVQRAEAAIKEGQNAELAWHEAAEHFARLGRHSRKHKPQQPKPAFHACTSLRCASHTPTSSPSKIISGSMMRTMMKVLAPSAWKSSPAKPASVPSAAPRNTGSRSSS